MLLPPLTPLIFRFSRICSPKIWNKSGLSPIRVFFCPFSWLLMCVCVCNSASGPGGLVHKRSFEIRDSAPPSLNRIQGTVLYIGPLRLQASLRARDLARYCELVGVGHRFGRVSVLAIMPSKFCPGKLEWTSNADCLKLNGWFAKPNISFIGGDIVTFVRRKLGNFCETRKLQRVQTHKTSSQKPSWHTGYNPSVST